MPKKDIHPEYNEVTIVMSDGSEFVTRSTMKTKDGTYRAEVDSKNHPFYNENLKMITATGRVDKFNKRYGKKS
ncbi:LSU ribosomal protein L31P [Cyclonatronum proteinivorum]|uniref:Large ribosomal subunit protein bL31 n=1 Tax=Cyclonatronum proteinivorum TaxID=1457365 RepID=A0A345UK18_9BACT|nr:50S ribosomal protein L31 [Cyclonatronum proteinivorum]AXJ00820.1 LSU ribosomal protein L31P [Cyclonatronum proteinivorum]